MTPWRDLERPTQLYAVRIVVKWWPEACDFYGGKLGLEERFRDDQLGWAESDLGGPCLGIERVAPGDAEGESLVDRFVGASLRVEDIEGLYNALKAKGVTFTGPPARQPWGGTLVHFKDPDGNELTLFG